MNKLGKIKSWYVDLDDDAAVELDTFDLCGETYNARFADIHGRMNYTYVNYE